MWVDLYKVGWLKLRLEDRREPALSITEERTFQAGEKTSIGTVLQVL